MPRPGAASIHWRPGVSSHVRSAMRVIPYWPSFRRVAANPLHRTSVPWRMPWMVTWPENRSSSEESMRRSTTAVDP